MARRDGSAHESAYKAISRALERMAGQERQPDCISGAAASAALPGGGILTVQVSGQNYREEARALAAVLGGTAGEDEAYLRGWRDCAALALDEARDMLGAFEELDERGRL